MSYYGYYADAAHGGAEAFSNPYNITIAFWYYDLGYVEIDNGVANGIYLSTSPTFARAHSDDDFDPGHTAALTFSLNTGVWHHAAGVWSASNARKVYSNGGTALGGAEATNTANTGLSLTTSRIRIGQGSIPAMADMAIWNNALSATEVAFLANGGRPHQLTSQLSNLVLYIPNRRASVTYPSGAPSVSTLDEQTGRLPTITDIVAAGTFQPVLNTIQIAPPHKE